MGDRMTHAEVAKLLTRLEKAGCRVRTSHTIGGGGKNVITAPDGTIATLVASKGNFRKPAEYEKWARKHGAQL